MNFAFDADQCAGSGQCHAVLAGTGLCQYFGLAHVFGQQGFAQAVVYFMSAGVVEVFAFEIDARAAAFFGQPAGEIDGAGAACVVSIQCGQFLLECFGLADLVVGIVDVVHDLFQFGRYYLAAVLAKITFIIWHCCKICRHKIPL